MDLQQGAALCRAVATHALPQKRTCRQSSRAMAPGVASPRMHRRATRNRRGCPRIPSRCDALRHARYAPAIISAVAALNIRSWRSRQRPDHCALPESPAASPAFAQRHSGFFFDPFCSL